MSQLSLYYHPFSPFARKIRVLIRELDSETLVKEVEINPFEQESELRKLNPLGKVPVLVEDGQAIYDSVVIADYLLNTLSDSGAGQMKTSSIAEATVLALADGLCDAINGFRSDQLRGLDEQPDWYHERLLHTIEQAVKQLTNRLPYYGNSINIASIAVACALDYYRFRFPQAALLKQSPELVSWLESFSRRSAMQQTAIENTEK